jgi:hypothetical protein
MQVSQFARDLEKPGFSQLSQGLWYSIVGSPKKDLELFNLLHALGVSRSGASFKGGIKKYRELLLDLAKRNGAQVSNKTECKRVFIEKGKFSGVQVSGRGNLVSGSFCILGCSLERALQKVTYTGTRWFTRPKKPLVPIGWKFTIAITVRKEAIPKGILPRAVWQEDQAPPVEIEIVEPKAYGVESDENRFIYLRTLMPFTGESLNLPYQRMISGRMMKLAMEIMPFLEYHVVRIFPDFRFTNQPLLPMKAGGETGAGPDSNELQELYGFASLEMIPDNLKTYEGDGLGASSGVNGLLLVSDESYPRLGSIGSTAAALEAVAKVANANGLAGPLV